MATVEEWSAFEWPWKQGDFSPQLFLMSYGVGNEIFIFWYLPYVWEDKSVEIAIYPLLEDLEAQTAYEKRSWK